MDCDGNLNENLLYFLTLKWFALIFTNIYFLLILMHSLLRNVFLKNYWKSRLYTIMAGWISHFLVPRKGKYWNKRIINDADYAMQIIIYFHDWAYGSLEVASIGPVGIIRLNHCSQWTIVWLKQTKRMKRGETCTWYILLKTAALVAQF